MLKRISALIVFCLVLSALFSCGTASDNDEDRIDIVTTIFPYYDFARSITGDTADITLLLPPGGDTHSYEPSAQDIIRISSCDLFIYTGGASDAWIETILDSLDNDIKVLRAMDYVDLYKTETVAGMTESHKHEHDSEHSADDDHDHSHDVFDEHIWTSPVNAAKICNAICDAVCELDVSNEDIEAYRVAVDSYTAALAELDSAFITLFDNCSKKTLVFGDRFPFRYFVEEYGLDYYAAFPGCSSETEMSASNLVFLINTVKSADVSTVFYIEFSNMQVADSLAESTGTVTALLHSCHNVSKADIDGGATYLSLMTQNLETLREALN